MCLYYLIKHAYIVCVCVYIYIYTHTHTHTHTHTNMKKQGIQRILFTAELFSNVEYFSYYIKLSSEYLNK